MGSPSICEKSQQELHIALREWFAYGAGARLADAERELLERLSEDIFGYHLVQVQDFGHGLGTFRQCPVKNRSLLDQCGDRVADASACARGEQLPLASDSVDLVVLPHTLDFALDPHQVLREVERVLIPEGRVLIVGFNPFSLWGLWRLALRWRGTVPWCGHFLSYRRIVDWLGLLGFDVEYTDVRAFAPPFRHEGWPRRLLWLERLGRHVWPMVAGVYAVRAVKRVSTVRPIRSPWAGLRVLSPQAIEPSARGGAHRTSD
jgi:SAM-dependent methyltransferase